MAFALQRAKVLGQLSMQLVSKISSLCGPDLPMLPIDRQMPCDHNTAATALCKPFHYSASCSKNDCFRQMTTCINSPGNVCVERWYLWIEFLISANEGILADFPDLTVVVPRRQVVGEVLSVDCHSARNLLLNLLNLCVPRYHFIDRLLSYPHITTQTKIVSAS